MRSIAVLTLLLGATHALAQPVYRWTDRTGQVHYTNDPSAVPPGARAETTDGDAVSEVGASPAPLPKRSSKPEPTPSAPPEPSRRAGPVVVKLTKVEAAVSDVDREYIESAIRAGAASPKLAAWGGLVESVDVEIAVKSRMKGCDGDGAFGLAIGRSLVLLRAPADTFSYGFALNYETTVVHELAHALEHQRAGLGSPRWFAEGYAMFVSDGPTVASIEDVAWWVIQKGGERPLDAMFDGPGRPKTYLAYAIAKEALAFLVRVTGQAGVLKMFALRAEGARFDDAFTQVTKLSLAEFQKRFAESLEPHYYERAN